MIGAITKALSKTKLGSTLSDVKEKGARGTVSEAFRSTPTGKLMSSVKDDKKESTSEDARVVSKSGASGLALSKETLGLLQTIDKDLKDVLDALGIQQQKEEAAKEEAKDEAKAQAVPAETVAADPETASLGKKFGKWGALIAGLVMQVAYPIYEVIKSVWAWLKDSVGKVFDFLKEKIFPILTELIPNFFMETIPEFFIETLPNMFNQGIDNIKGKFTAILDGISTIVAGMKETIGGFITNLADSGAAKFLLSDNVRSGIKAFGQEMVKTGAASKKEAIDKAATSAAAPRTAPVPAIAQPAVATKPTAPPYAEATAKPTATTSELKDTTGKTLETIDTINTELEWQSYKIQTYIDQRRELITAGNTKEADKIQTYISKAQTRVIQLQKLKEDKLKAGMVPGVATPSALSASASMPSSAYAASVGPASASATVSGAASGGGQAAQVATGGGAGAGVASSSASAAMLGPAPGAAPGTVSGGGEGAQAVTSGGAGAAVAKASVSGGGMGGMSSTTGGETASTMTSTGTGAAVSSASMAVTAPEPPPANETNGTPPSKSMSKQKANSDPVNPVANVPDVSPNLGNIANLWYHNSSALVY